MAARPKGSKRNPLTEDDFPFLVQRAANYWILVNDRLVETPRAHRGEVLTLEERPTETQRVLGEVPV